MKHRSWVRDGLLAGSVGGLVAGIPSTLHTALKRGDLLASTRAAGILLLPESRSKALLTVAGATAHSVISLGWGVAMARGLGTRAGPMTGAAAGLAIAALDLGVLARRVPAIRRLPVIPQILDHLVYGAAVGAVLQRRRALALTARARREAFARAPGRDGTGRPGGRAGPSSGRPGR